jgi:hypothetical protein
MTVPGSVTARAGIRIGPSDTPIGKPRYLAGRYNVIQDVSHGEPCTERDQSPKPLGPFGIAVLAFRDPDNIQVELTAPLG